VEISFATILMKNAGHALNKRSTRNNEQDLSRDQPGQHLLASTLSTLDPFHIGNPRNLQLEFTRLGLTLKSKSPFLSMMEMLGMISK
jgi:hypothetical protein